MISVRKRKTARYRAVLLCRVILGARGGEDRRRTQSDLFEKGVCMRNPSKFNRPSSGKSGRKGSLFKKTLSRFRGDFCGRKGAIRHAGRIARRYRILTGMPFSHLFKHAPEESHDMRVFLPADKADV